MNTLESGNCGTSRREFAKQTLAATASLAIAGLAAPFELACASEGRPKAPAPWYRRALRWGQTNITELDATRYDIPWWRQYWKRTQVQGVIINAGGIFAYYPSRFPMHHRAEFLGDRDLYGELSRAAHEDGLAVLARMDSSRAHEDFYRAHPEWFAADASGRPYRTGELIYACVNGPYYREYLPDVLREIIERSHPEGVTDNSWSGITRDRICHCVNCAKKYHDQTGHDLPHEKNWDDAVYREWIRWSYACRLEIWDLNNRTTKSAGGPDCLWIGMNGGSISSQSASFRDCKAICERAEIIMFDHQARSDATGFQENGAAGKLFHGLLGWNKLIPESMAMYQAGRPGFRLTSKPEPEARLWVLEGFAGGIQPWWHHVGAYQEDRRMFHTIEPLNRWHRANETYLIDREPIANVGVVWSQQNTDFYGRDNPEELVDLPYRGFVTALIRERIPWLPVHADHIERDSAKLSVLVLPNIGAMSDSQCESVRRFVQRGGGIVATGESSLCDEAGEVRKDFALADIFGVHVPAGQQRDNWSAKVADATATNHTYLRLTPELGAQVDGPRTGKEPPVTGARHPILAGFDETDLLPYGGKLRELSVDSGCETLATFVPSLPYTPPESVWMREPRTNLPGLITRTSREGARIVFMPADIDRRYARDNLPDHGNLLANAVRWAVKDDFPLEVEGKGLVDCHLYRQANRLILHIVNLTNAGTWRAAVDELIPIGPVRARVKLPEKARVDGVRSLVTGSKLSATTHQNLVTFELRSILDHEVAVIEFTVRRH